MYWVGNEWCKLSGGFFSFLFGDVTYCEYQCGGGKGEGGMVFDDELVVD